MLNSLLDAKLMPNWSKLMHNIQFEFVQVFNQRQSKQNVQTVTMSAQTYKSEYYEQCLPLACETKEK